MMPIIPSENFSKDSTTKDGKSAWYSGFKCTLPLLKKSISHGGLTYEAQSSTFIFKNLFSIYFEDFCNKKITNTLVGKYLIILDFLTNKKINNKNIKDLMEDAEIFTLKNEKELTNQKEERHDLFNKTLFTYKREIDGYVKECKEGNKKRAESKCSNPPSIYSNGNLSSAIDSEKIISIEENNKINNISDNTNPISKNKPVIENEIEIDLIIKKVKGSEFNKLLLSFKNFSNYNEILNSTDNECKINADKTYNLIIEIGRDFSRDANIKIFQLFKLITMFNNFREVYDINSEYIKKNNIDCNKFNCKNSNKLQHLCWDAEDQNIFIIITNGDYSNIPRTEEELESQIIECSNEYYYSKLLSLKSFKYFKNIIKDEIVYIFHLPDLISIFN